MSKHPPNLGDRTGVRLPTTALPCQLSMMRFNPGGQRGRPRVCARNAREVNSRRPSDRPRVAFTPPSWEFPANGNVNRDPAGGNLPVLRPVPGADND